MIPQLRSAPSAGRWAVVGTLVAICLMAVPPVAASAPQPTTAAARAEPAATGPAAELSVAALRAAPRVAVDDALSDQVIPGSTAFPTAPTGELSVVVTLAYSNSSRLGALLRELARPAGSARPAYLSALQFDREFGGSPQVYRAAAAYFGSFGVGRLVTYSDRATLTFEASPQTAGEAFGTRIGAFEWDGEPYLAPTGPVELPAPIASSVLQVEGLGTSPTDRGQMMNDGVVSRGADSPDARGAIPSVGSYLAPAQLGSAQIEYAPDFQVAYDERSLLAAYREPTNATVVLITGAGTYSGSSTSACGTTLASETDVGGWVPGDVSAFYNATLPAHEVKPTVTGVPIGGAATPGCLASWDSTGTTAANTVDLEMIGSTAPGARIYGVYAPNASKASLDTVFATVLDPGASLGPSLAAQLGNATVLVTPWGFADGNDSSWFSSLEQTEARGLSVLAATGDSGDDPASARWVGTQAEFPASMAYSAFGDTAVGGTTVTLDPKTLEISREVAWNVSSKDTAQGGPKGTAGGPSQIFKQPSWMKASSAGVLLGSLGRGVPDIVALANDTAATVSVDGHRYEATNASSGGAFYNASGTGVAAALAAGQIAEVDHALLANHDAILGFPDPTIYPVANAEYAPLPTGKVHDSIATGAYSASLPTLPFLGAGGRNFADRAGKPGYNLVTGWGSLDVYNFTMYIVVPPKLPSRGPLEAVQDWVNLTGLGVVAGAPGASVQQNTFLANSLGAPIIWVQSVLYLSPKANGEWDVNFTGWVVYPFFGLYPNESVYDYWFPAGRSVSLPASWDLTTSINRATPSWDATITFSFGNGIAAITLPAPGADYLLGGLDASYDWQGENHTDGPRGPVASVGGFLAPQIGLYGYPGGTLGNFTSATAGSIQSYVEPLGASAFEPARTTVVTLANSQTGETAASLGYTATAPNDYSLAYALGATEQGITTSLPYPYSVEFSQTGAPASLTWSVALTGGRHLSALGTTPSVTTPLENGTYDWTATISSANYTATVSSGGFTIDGSGTSVTLEYVARTDGVEFIASGAMAFPFDWSVAITGGPTLSGHGPDLETNLTYAKYLYKVLWTNRSWTPSRTTGSFTIGPTFASVQVDFSLVTFDAKIIASYGIGAPPTWTVTVDGVEKRGPVTKAVIYVLPNGTYSYSISGLPPGYVAKPSSGIFVVHGDPPPKVVVQVIPPPKASGLFGLGLWGDVLGGGLATAAIALVLLVRRRRRQRRAQRKAEKGSAAPPPPRARRPPPTAPDRPERGRGRDRYLDPEQL